MSEKFNNPNNVIKGPWGEKPLKKEHLPAEARSTDESEADSVSTEVSSILGSVANKENFFEEVFRQARESISGTNVAFEKIYQTAKSSKPMEAKVQEQMSKYRGWTREDLRNFANNENNHLNFKQKPTLVVAIYRLLFGEL